MFSPKWATALFLCVAFPASLRAQAPDLIISEYVEGGGNEKYIEIYNGTGAAVNLADYQLRLFANGAATPSSTSALSGTLANGAVVVYRNSLATLYPAATVLAAINFNGDDAMAIYKISTASYVDIFGQIGCDPGSAWTGTGTSTLDRTLRRRSNICAGITTNPGALCSVNSFTTLTTEWDAFPVNDVSGLGSHTMTCGPTVNFASPTTTVNENAGSVLVTLDLAPATTVAGTITIAVANGAGVTYGAGGDYTTTPAVAGGVITLNVAAGATSASFTVTVNDDLATELDEIITFTITGTTGGIALGAVLGHVFTIVDNDAVPTVNFSTLSIAVIEGAGLQTFNLGLFPAPAVAGTITIQVTNGPGAVYGAGNDYTSTPAVVGGVITLNFAAGATIASFNVLVNNDTEVEATEQITFTITGATGGMVLGGNLVATLTIGDNDTPPTVLEPGDLVVLGVNSNDFACTGGAGGDDLISFFCFKPIVPGTTLIITDNGYSRCTPGLWGNSEGTVRMTRTGIAIPAGQVITFRITNMSGPSNVTSVAPDAGWTCTTLNAPAGATFGTSVALNAGGDQLFFMQGGTWNSGTAVGTAYDHNATYDGAILFGFSNNPAFPWSATCLSADGGNQRSDLPPGIECFSMAPTLATDFNKYIGPITAATQRDWIIRVDNTPNWTTYANCADYNALGYNWLAAPIMPIINAGFSPGLWRGVVSTDWFDCRNWDDARIPTVTTDVLIDQTATRNCVVGLSTGLVPGGTGECASVLLTTNAAGRSLTVDLNSTLDIQGPLTVERTAGAGITFTTVLGNATLNATDVWLGSVNPGTIEAVLYSEPSTSTVALSGGITIAPGGTLDMQGAGTNGGTLLLQGDFTNLAGENRFIETNGRVVFTGGNDQYINTAGFEDVFFRLAMNKSGGDLYLNAPIAVRDELDLTAGRIFTTATELLTSRVLSVAVNASDASFVHGPMRKQGVVDFEFPVGKGGSLRPCSLVGHLGVAPAAFVAEYFPLSPRTTFNNVLEPALDHISDCEYWMIDRTEGTSTAFVELTWDTPESCGVDDLPSLRVARWDGSIWLDRGNGMVDGNTTTGAVRTSAAQSLFSPWTLASVNGLNPLPISLLEFAARPEGRTVALRWSTVSERDNAYFTVERSRDGLSFERLIDVAGAGTSFSTMHYAATDDQPFTGWNHYRLRQTDLDGQSTLSHVVNVWMDSSGRPLAVFAQAGQLMAWHDMPAGSRYELLDMTSRLIASGSTTQDGSTVIGTGDLPNGVYLFRLINGQRNESVRFVY